MGGGDEKEIMAAHVDKIPGGEDKNKDKKEGGKEDDARAALRA